MKRITWRVVITFCALNLCLLGWAVIEAVKWVAGLVSCV